jgi:hypothetical protein
MAGYWQNNYDKTAAAVFLWLETAADMMMKMTQMLETPLK